MNRKRRIAAVCAACLSFSLLTMGCRQPEAATSENSPRDASESVALELDSVLDQQQTDELLAAKDELLQRLSKRLMSAMSLGPSKAISVCQKEATSIARQVAEDHGVQIGRVGVRLRNPANTGPSWATPLIEARRNTPVFGKLSNGHTAALLPIKLQSQCLMCHGPTEQIAPIIRDELSRRYPDDQATGFLEGELRGWFWVEKPST